MAEFARRRCLDCKTEQMARISVVQPFGRLVRTTQCWACGTARVERLVSEGEWRRRRPYQPIEETAHEVDV